MSLLLLLAGCTSQNRHALEAQTLSQARSGFKSTLLTQTSDKKPADQPPHQLFLTVQYPASSGDLIAYLSPSPGDGRKHPAIIWITGGDCNSIGDVWSAATRDNDQTAAAYRNAGIVMMFPSLRGGNVNPGIKEGFLGEVDDVLAAMKYLEKQPYVDPQRIYLGGHSTGGTLAMLVAECSKRYRAVFAFGPVDDVAGYGQDSGYVPFDITNKYEDELRSPGFWLHSIQSPLWVIEGTGGNIQALRTMAKDTSNPLAHFIEINGVGHFATLAPTNELIANKILQDAGAKSNITISEAEVNSLQFVK